MQNNLMFTPGRQLSRFEVLRPATRLDAKGRALKGDYRRVGAVWGSIAAAGEHEVLRQKQIGHTVTHTLVIQLRAGVRAEDLLLQGGRAYYVHGVDNPGGLGLYTVLSLEHKPGAQPAITREEAGP